MNVTDLGSFACVCKQQLVLPIDTHNKNLGVAVNVRVKKKNYVFAGIITDPMFGDCFL